MKGSRSQALETDGPCQQQAEEVLRRLPDDATLEDIQYHLYVLEKIRKGQNDIAEGHSYTH